MVAKTKCHLGLGIHKFNFQLSLIFILFVNNMQVIYLIDAIKRPYKLSIYRHTNINSKSEKKNTAK